MFRPVPVLLLLFLTLLIMGLSQSANSTPALFGNWRGSVYQPELGSYIAQMSLHGTKGTVEYPSLGCGGTVALLNISGNEYRYAQHIIYGNIASGGICIEDDLITATVQGDSMDFEGSGQFQGRTYTAKGILERQSENLANESVGWPNLTKPLDVTNSTQQFNTANSTPKVLPHAAFASATFYGPTPYLSSRDSPFFGTKFSYFYLEDFEDGLLNTPGVTASSGWSVILGNNEIDSVDADDGVIDGQGNTGKSFFSNFVSSSLTFTFNAAALGGNLPTHTGIVWTDANASASRSQVEFSALDSSGTSLGSIGPFGLGDSVISGTTAEDRFFGVYNPSGISSITISMHGSNNWEVDHLQYGSVIEKQTAVPYPDLTATQPQILSHLNLTASALGKTTDSSPLELHVPLNVGIDVSFKGYVTEGSNSAFYTGYRYHWIIDGVRQSSEEAQLTQLLLPRDNSYNVVLKAEKLDNTAAQNTPPVYNPNPVKPTINASIQVSIKPHPEWDCKGRLGAGCNDGSYTNNATTWIKVEPLCDEQGQICIKSQMSVGAIRHDLCCKSTPSLYFCSGPRSQLTKVIKDPSTLLIKETCEKEYEQAERDRFDKKAMFDYTWKYLPAGNRPSEGKHGWWIGLAPPGIVVSREESEPNPTEKAICKSGDVEPVKTLVQLPVNATYIRGNTIEKTTSWFCSANKSDQKINKPPLVNPQGKIDTVEKITPAANIKANKVTRDACNKGSSVLSPSTGGAEGELKKYGTGTDGCAQ